MSVIIGRVAEHDLSNITVGGKVIFVPPEKRNTAWLNFPNGSVAKVTFDKGTATSIVPPSEAEMAAFTREELVGKPLPGPTATPVKPAAKTDEEKAALEKFRALPKDEQNRLIAKTAREILEDPEALKEIASVLSSAIARKLKGVPS